MEAIFTRRSIRKFSDKPIDDETIEILLKAAMQAPSAGNQQAWEFIIVRNEKTLKKLSEISPYAKPLAKAPAAILVLGNMTKAVYPAYWQQDLAAATQNILLESVVMGLGSVWLGVGPDEERMAAVRKIFDLPLQILPFAIIPIGYPLEENKYINRYNAEKVHEESYS